MSREQVVSGRLISTPYYDMTSIAMVMGGASAGYRLQVAQNLLRFSLTRLDDALPEGAVSVYAREVAP